MGTVAQELQELFAKLQRASEHAVNAGVTASTLALLYHPDGASGLVPARFRETTQKTAGKELQAFATQVERLSVAIGAGVSNPKVQKAVSERLARTIASLHQTAILLLADHGFSDRAQLEALARALIYNHSIAPMGHHAELLGRASMAARRAIKAISNANEPVEVQTKGAPENRRAMVAVRLLATAYRQITGEEPGLTVNSLKDGSPVSGEFFDFVKASFKVLNIEASAEAYIRKWRAERANSS